ncbi:MAG: hypothetical protein Alpg2KO_24950 [Alphaproteobacteria bacterium]
MVDIVRPMFTLTHSGKGYAAIGGLGFVVQQGLSVLASMLTKVTYTPIVMEVSYELGGGIILSGQGGLHVGFVAFPDGYVNDYFQVGLGLLLVLVGLL